MPLINHQIRRAARMEGIVVFDWADRYGEAVKQIAQWMREGKNFGKLVLKVADS